ncbi:small basic family protein [Zhaonella formicivorans]|jgi:small basic protein|uniref:small basic family protein n=1 Tax=Zhaonella formicivorans TaxID=2528593 RepID=UPI0010DE5A46|nr:small basic family protein [Zhaonella formicivorans]
MWLPLLGLLIGVLIGLLFPYQIPVAYAKYMSVAALAALDSVFGGLRSGMENKFDSGIFLSGFFSNTLLAGLLAYIGDQLGVELYMAAVFAFGVRLFQNLAIIRRFLLKK